MRSNFSGKNVLRRLISKAEKRKLQAENVRIYALLQSTVLRLELDKNNLRERQIICKHLKSCVNHTEKERLGANRSIPKKSSDSDSICVDSHDQDPLNLNSFFEKLKER